MTPFSDSSYRTTRLPISYWADPLRLINQAFRDEGYDSDRFETYTSQTFFPVLAGASELRDLGKAVAYCLDLPESFVSDGAQIALRFPGEKKGLDPHVDGIPSEGNGVVPGEPFKCDAIIGLYLSPVTVDSGPLVLWQGSHKEIAKFIKERGRKLLAQGVLPDLDETSSTVIEGGAGHAFAYHPQTVHGTLPNRSLGIRYAVYWRFYDPQQQSS